MLADPLVFGRSDVDDLELLRLLREATSHLVRLRWTLAGTPRFPLRTHVHLVPPIGGVDPSSARYARDWAAGYRYGSYFYRAGPGFALLKDTRPGGEPARLTIVDGAEHFFAMAGARRVEELSGPARELLDEADDAGLLLRRQEHLLMLPYRLRHWPVPYLAI